MEQKENSEINESALKLMIELRQEMMEAQRIRTQIIGFKITFIATAIGVVIANSNNIPLQLLVVPAFSAFFFDLLIIHYDDAAKLIAYYHRTCVQDKLPEWLGPRQWETWTRSDSVPKVGPRYLPVLGNLGLTLLATAPAYFTLVKPFNIKLSLPLCIMLIVLNLCDIYLHFRTTRGNLDGSHIPHPLA